MNKILFLTGLVSLLIFSDCKKGPDDPFLSLRSRKARVTGDWKMTKGSNSNASSSNSSNSTNETTYDGSTYTTNSNNTFSGVTTQTTEVGTYSLKMSFKKDGKFTYEEMQDGDTFTFSGTWNFTGGVGDKKNKEQIVLHGTESSSSGYTSAITGNQVDVTFDIKELRNKKMVFTLDNNNTEVNNSGNNSESSYKAEFTFEQ